MPAVSPWARSGRPRPPKQVGAAGRDRGIALSAADGPDYNGPMLAAHLHKEL